MKKRIQHFIEGFAGLKFRIPVYNCKCPHCNKEIDVQKMIGKRPQHKGGFVKLENKKTYEEPEKKKLKSEMPSEEGEETL